MILESSTTTLNVRTVAGGPILGEMRLGDTIEVAAADMANEWVKGTVSAGVSAGLHGYVRRRWLIQHFDSSPVLNDVDRKAVAELITTKTTEFDGVTYGLGSKADSWKSLQKKGVIDCSGWVYLLSQEVLKASGKATAAKRLYTYSDEQITNAAEETGVLISGRFLTAQHFQPGVIVGLDNSEYSWDRHRPLDIDHVVIVGADSKGIFVSQSSSSGGGVNRVQFERWWEGMASLAALGRIHLVDLFAF